MNTITLFDTSIRQDAQGRFCLNDLHRASGGANRHRPSLWAKTEQSKELAQELSKAGITALVVTHGGTRQGVYVRRELIYAYAMWISAKFHLAVIRAFDAMQIQRVQQAVLPRPQPAYMREAWFAVLSHMAQQMVHRALARALQIHESTLSQVLGGSGKYGAGTASMAGMEARVLRTFCHARSRLRRAAPARQLTLI